MTRVRFWTVEKRDELLQRFESATEGPLLVLAVLMVPLLILPLVADLPEPAETAFIALDWFIWAVFAFQFLWRLILTTNRWKFVRREWTDLLIVVVPLLRPLRILQVARFGRLLGLVRLVAVFGEISKEAKRLLVRHQLHYAILAAIVLLLGSAVAITVLEKEAHGNIRDFGDGIWWAITTVTTVGYGDRYPVTDAGRGIAMLLMVMGIALFGVVTANLAAFMLDREADSEQDEREARDPFDGIRRLGQLHAEGFITQREFVAKKSELLGRI